jgi:hypothetical protein
MNTRRHFLCSSTAILALPFLESLGFRRFVRAADASARPKRLVFLGIGFGVTEETWYPKQDDVGPGYTLPAGLAPLARHKSDFTIIQNCWNEFATDPHGGSSVWLSGGNKDRLLGKSNAMAISADQVAAAQFGVHTRFTSMQLDPSESVGYGHGSFMSWDAKGKPMPTFPSPVVTFHKLFSAGSVPLAQRQQMLADDRSVLDDMLADARSLERGLGAADRDKLEEYFDSIRAIETRLAKEERWLGVAKPKTPLAEPRQGLVGREEVRVMYDLIVAALQTDSTRVISYRQPITALLRSLKIELAGHDVSHYLPGARMEASQMRDRALSELLATLLDKLKTTKEPDGSSLFDHTTVAFGGNIRSIHYLDNCPTLIAGRGAGIRLGQHLVAPKHTPLSNVWLTLLQGSGVKVERHGDSTGVVKEMIA